MIADIVWSRSLLKEMNGGYGTGVECEEKVGRFSKEGALYGNFMARSLSAELALDAEFLKFKQCYSCQNLKTFFAHVQLYSIRSTDHLIVILSLLVLCRIVYLVVQTQRLVPVSLAPPSEREIPCGTIPCALHPPFLPATSLRKEVFGILG